MTRRLVVAALALVAGCALPDPVQLVGADLVQLDAGGQRTCGLDGQGLVYCWGREGDGAITLPTQIGLGALRFVEVKAGANYSCALTVAGAPLCWVGIRGRPFRLEGAPPLEHIAVGRFTCGSEADGAIWCWTEGGTDPVMVSIAGALGEVRVDQFACALTPDSRIRCWGGPFPATPTPVHDTLTFSEVQPMFGWGCAIPTGGSAACFSVSGVGAVGTLTPVSTAILGGGGAKFIHVEGEQGWVSLMSNIGRAYYKTTGSVNVTPEGSTVSWLSLTMGAGHACGELVDGRFACVWENSYGEIGDGTQVWRANAAVVGGNTP